MRVLIAALLLTSFAAADEWVTPTPRTLTSPDGKRSAVITPASKKAGATVEMLAGKTKKRTFELKTVPVDAVLFDDGSLLVLDHWHQLGFGNVATLYTADGKPRWTKTLEQLIGKSLVERAQHSVSSIWWRKVPLEWTLDADRKSGTITLFDENQVRLTLADGSASLVSVGNLPADAERLLNRARVLAREGGRRDEAIALLDRVIALDPARLEAVRIEAELFANANEHARVIALLDRVSPGWKTTDNSEVANLCIIWAKSLRTLDRHPEAEKKLRLGIAAAPAYPNPTIELATMLADQKRTKDADVVLDEFVARLFKAPYLDTYALTTVAEYYERVDPKKALAVYLKAYKKDEVTNQFLYAQLAALHEKLGNTAEAIRIHEQLLAYFQKMGSAFDSYTKSTRETLARLRAKPKTKP